VAEFVRHQGKYRREVKNEKIADHPASTIFWQPTQEEDSERTEAKLENQQPLVHLVPLSVPADRAQHQRLGGHPQPAEGTLNIRGDVAELARGNGWCGRRLRQAAVKLVGATLPALNRDILVFTSAIGTLFHNSGSGRFHLRPKNIKRK
jgi:hypothetical protein